jgi:PKD repeat protein
MSPLPRASRPPSFRPWFAPLRLALAALALGAVARAQQPLFTFVQTSDSQAATEADWQRFEDVLEVIANGGRAGALLPRPVDLVLFPGDITESNENAEWVRCMNLFGTYLTANGIPLLATPGNRDQGASAGQTQLYQQFLGSPGVWDVSSASFTGQNGVTRNIGWSGLRLIGFNNSSGAWNKLADADIALIQSRVNAAAAASENVLLVSHHPHDGQGRIPLASILTQPAIVGYLRGHSGNPRAVKGLSGVVNPNVYDLNTNSIVDDRDLIYVEVFATELKAYVVVLDTSSTLPTPVRIPLVFPLRPPLAQNVGFQGGSHAGARAWPSGHAPEKKLWFQGGRWFGVLWHEPALAWRIFRLEPATQLWTDTGTSVSTSSTRSFDALADGASRLYLATHAYSVPSAPGAGAGASVLRYSFNATTRTYALDAGFPVTINDVRSETLSLAKDSLGTLWATWTAGGEVWVARTLGGNDASWSAPALLPFPAASGLDAEDVSAAVAFDGKVAILWTDRVSGELGCAVRADTAAPTTWLFESALVAPGAVGDALDVASSAGRLFVASSSPSGAVRLLRRQVGLAGSGVWSQHTVADAATGLAQPIVLADEALQLVRVFATGASSTGGTALGGGVIYEKSAPLATLAFAAGKGTVVIQDGQNFAMGRASSTRQALNATTALVVTASNELSQRSWHEFTSLGTPPVAPVADFSGTPRAGSAPLVVRFSDLSSGAPTSWAWTFGDGTSASVQNPEHAYAQPGSYTVSLTVANSAGSDDLVRTAYVTVSAPSPTLTLTPIADTTAGESNKNTNFGTNDTLRVRSQGGSSFRAFLRFDLAGITAPILGAKLRLWVTDDSTNGGTLTRVAGTWSETTLTWNNQPALGTTITSVGATALGTWKELDVSAAVAGTGTVAFALTGGSGNLATYASREGAAANRPQLVLTLGAPPQPPVAEFTGAPLDGEAPLAVQFTDLSSNAPSTWSWSFGDGASATQQSPTHVYATPGTYAVTLVASNAGGTSTRTRPGYVTVRAPTTQTFTFRPAADARVSEASPSSNFGTSSELRAKTQAGSSFQSFLRFDLTGLAGHPTSARLRLFVTDESNSGGALYLVSNAWTEAGLTWANRPALPTLALATAGNAPAGAWLELDVSAAVLGPGTLALGLASPSTNSVFYSSREGANPPELVVETRNVQPPPVASHAQKPAH